MSRFPKVYEYKYSFGKTEDEMLDIAVGMASVGFENEESTEDYQYLANKGVAETDILGQKISWTFEGHRELSDELQELVFKDMLFDLGNRDGYFKMVAPDGWTVEGPAKVVDIVPLGGDSTDRNEASFTVVLAGRPTVGKEE